jgi:hypothetical protein
VSTDARVSPPGRKRRVGLGAAGAVLFAGGLVVGIILAGLNVAGAQTSSSPSPSVGSHAPSFPKFGRFGPPFGHFGFGFGAIHGEFTTTAPGGGYETLATQVGTVTSVSSSSITVKSVDGFTRFYGIDANTEVTAVNNGISDVKSGDTVRVLAVVSGGKASAVDLVDATRAQQLRGRWQPPFPSEPGAG